MPPMQLPGVRRSPALRGRCTRRTTVGASPESYSFLCAAGCDMVLLGRYARRSVRGPVVVTAINQHGQRPNRSAQCAVVRTAQWSRADLRAPGAADVDPAVDRHECEGPFGPRASSLTRMSITAFHGGSGGIRTPGPVRDVRFQGGCNRPLCHASADQARRPGPRRDNPRICEWRHPSDVRCQPCAIAGTRTLRAGASRPSARRRRRGRGARRRRAGRRSARARRAGGRAPRARGGRSPRG